MAKKAHFCAVNYLMTIAGHDPSGGAGLQADIKTFEQHGHFGLSVCTCITVQTEDEFHRVEPVDYALIEQQAEVLIYRYDVEYVKIGMWPHGARQLERFIQFLRDRGVLFIIWDPILRVSAGAQVSQALSRDELAQLLSKIDLLTPNTMEAQAIAKQLQLEFPEAINNFCPVLIKGGHTAQKGEDKYVENNQQTVFPSLGITHDKHGSGCVLSASILSEHIKGASIIESIESARAYTHRWLASHSSLLGRHA